MKNVYVVSIIGQGVYNGYSIQAVIESMEELDKVRKQLKKEFNIEFGTTNVSKWQHIMTNYYVYENISDDRDVYLIIEQIEYYSKQE